MVSLNKLKSYKFTSILAQRSAQSGIYHVYGYKFRYTRYMPHEGRLNLHLRHHGVQTVLPITFGNRDFNK